MTITKESAVYYDPYDVGINADPYPTYRRLRDEAPIYYNEKFDVWALSRHADVEQACVNWRTFSSSRGDILEIVQSGMELPSGVVLFEDPPLHTMHRGLMSRVFTPKRMAALEDQVRAFCARCLDPLVGRDRFDIVAELGAVMPMRVIGMLLGIPEDDQTAVRDKSDAFLRTEAGRPMAVRQESIANGEMFAEYIEWRSHHPSDDLMTALLNAEFEDETGTTRTLTRPEVLTYTQVLAGAGNETTGRLIGWLAKVLAEHPDQRRELVEDRSLLSRTIDETLRFEPTGPHTARYVTQDVEYYGTTVPAGSAILLLLGAANRDERRYPDPDTFDIHREDIQHLTFGYGLHYCLGANLARLEGTVALDELLTRFPEWDVDYDNIKLAPTSTVRGWESMPIIVG
jgi:cytochrome P450